MSADSSRTHSVVGIFAGSTPDPTAWNYNPQRRIGGAFFNVHGGSFETFRYSNTVGVRGRDAEMGDQSALRLHREQLLVQALLLALSLDADRSTDCESIARRQWAAGLGQSLLSLRVQVHPRVTLDLTDTYFRDVPTYDPTLVGTGLLDKYLYQGINGGARIRVPDAHHGLLQPGQQQQIPRIQRAR